MSQPSRLIGFAEIKPAPECELFDAGTVGAYVTVVSLAETDAEFREIVSRELAKHHIALLALDQIEDYESYHARLELEEDLVEAAAALDDDEPVAFGTFHSFGSKEDADEE